MEDEGSEAGGWVSDGVVGLDVLEVLGVDELELQVVKTLGEGIRGRGHAVAVDLSEDNGVALSHAGIDVGQAANQVAQGSLSGIAFVHVQRQGGGVRGVAGGEAKA